MLQVGFKFKAMSHTGRLAEELALEGLEAPAWPASFLAERSDVDWSQQTLAYAKSIRAWRLCFEGMPEHQYKAIDARIRSSYGQESLLNWEEMLLTLSALDRNLLIGQGSWDALAYAAIKHSESLPEVAGFAIAEAHTGRLAVASRCISNIIKNPSISFETCCSIIDLLVQEANLEWYFQEAGYNQAYWNVLIQILQRFIELSSLVLRSTYSEERLSSEEHPSILEQFALILENVYSLTRGHSRWVGLPKSEIEILLGDDCTEMALSLLQDRINSRYPARQSSSLARFILSRALIGIGKWGQLNHLHTEAVQEIVGCNEFFAAFKDDVAILHSESELISTEISLALNRQSIISEDHSLTTLNHSDPRDMASYSQSQLGQDVWVLDRLHWKTGGYFVEFGATDGVLLSNTWLLEKYFHWDGVCAEPNPTLFAKLRQNRNCFTSQACVFRSSGERMRFILADAYGGLADYAHEDCHADKRDAYARKGNYVEITTISLMDLLAEAGAPPVIDYLSIDTEGSEYAVLEGIDWDRYAFRCITVEHNYGPQRLSIRALLEGAHGYSVIERKFDDWYYKDID